MALRKTPRVGGRRAPLPPEVFFRRRRARRLSAAAMGLAILAALAVADRRGWFLQSGDWGKYQGKSFLVARVVDGDTLDVDVPDGKRARTRIRLWGIDTPEMNVGKPERGPEPWAVEATQRARELAEGTRVTLELQAHEIRGRYGRLLAYVRLPDGVYLNEQLLLEGLARADRRFPHERMERYVLLEAQAKRKAIGLWTKPARSRAPRSGRQPLVGAAPGTQP